MINNSLSLPIKIPREELHQFCDRHHVIKLSLFGSVLRNDFTDDSDLDFLVEFQVHYIPTFLKLAQMERELSELLYGRSIDLRTLEELSPYFRDKVLEEAIVQYDSTR